MEFTVLLDGERLYFTIETAPTPLVPHSIHAFMSMVETKAWDGAALMFVEIHKGVIIASVDDDKDNVPVNDKLTKRLLFPEYSHEFPHHKNTVGFGGNPGGPNFYFNLADNSDIHGPGGQAKHELMGEADSCFAKITHGADIMDKINDRIKYNRLDLLIEKLNFISAVIE